MEDGSIGAGIKNTMQEVRVLAALEMFKGGSSAVLAYQQSNSNIIACNNRIFARMRDAVQSVVYAESKRTLLIFVVITLYVLSLY